MPQKVKPHRASTAYLKQRVVMGMADASTINIMSSDSTSVARIPSTGLRDETHTASRSPRIDVNNSGSHSPRRPPSAAKSRPTTADGQGHSRNRYAGGRRSRMGTGEHHDQEEKSTERNPGGPASGHSTGRRSRVSTLENHDQGEKSTERNPGGPASGHSTGRRSRVSTLENHDQGEKSTERNPGLLSTGSVASQGQRRHSLTTDPSDGDHHHSHNTRHHHNHRPPATASRYHVGADPAVVRSGIVR
jgi:hypothetical protein